MKLSRTNLRHLIKEELRVLLERGSPPPAGRARSSSRKAWDSAWRDTMGILTDAQWKQIVDKLNTDHPDQAARLYLSHEPDARQLKDAKDTLYKHTVANDHRALELVPGLSSPGGAPGKALEIARTKKVMMIGMNNIGGSRHITILLDDNFIKPDDPGLDTLLSVIYDIAPEAVESIA